MAYLGQGAEGNFTTTNAKDAFSGNGSTTTFTLSQRGTENNVDVFVNNVRQEPNVAYNIEGNGTSLVFTAAPSSGTNNIYVVNRGPAELSASHPATQNLEAVDGTFTGDLTVDTDTLYVDSTNNLVGIGTSSPSGRMTIYGNGGVPLRWGNTSNLGALTYSGSDPIIQSSTGNTLFYQGSSEKMRILAGGGITFNGDTAAANALDDYEEGTWTPTSSEGTLTVSRSNYTKIGRQVTLNCTVKYSTPSSSGNTFELQGLPFSSTADVEFIGSAMINGLNVTSTSTYSYIYGGAATTGIKVYQNRDNSSVLALPFNAFGTNEPIYISVTYTIT
jgi:hypothetical protein